MFLLPSIRFAEISSLSSCCLGGHVARAGDRQPGLLGSLCRVRQLCGLVGEREAGRLGSLPALGEDEIEWDGAAGIDCPGLLGLLSRARRGAWSRVGVWRGQLGLLSYFLALPLTAVPFLHHCISGKPADHLPAMAVMCPPALGTLAFRGQHGLGARRRRDFKRGRGA